MKADIKVKWIAALVSGEYKQGKSRLQTEDHTFCCLGVLADIRNKELNLNRDSTIGQCYLDKVDIVWAGLNDYQGIYHYNHKGSDGESNLAHENDNGKSFKEIADIIDKYF